MGFTSDAHIVQKPGQLVQMQCLGAVDKCLFRPGMKIDKYHVGTGDNALCGYVHDVQDSVRATIAATLGM